MLAFSPSHPTPIPSVDQALNPLPLQRSDRRCGRRWRRRTGTPDRDEPCVAAARQVGSAGLAAAGHTCRFPSHRGRGARPNRAGQERRHGSPPRRFAAGYRSRHLGRDLDLRGDGLGNAGNRRTNGHAVEFAEEEAPAARFVPAPRAGRCRHRDTGGPDHP